MPTAERIASWMRRQLAGAGARGFVVGLSGGLDSAVVARLAQLAAPGQVIAALLPCHSDPADERDAALVAAHFSLTAVRIDLGDTYDGEVRGAQVALAAVPDQMRSARPADPLRGRVPLANIKPRLRMTTLYFLANSLNYLVAGTGNRSELSIGYFTKYGDGGVDLLPIGQLLKSEVRALARELNVPAAIIERAERGAVDRTERRSGDGIHLRRSRALSRGGSAGRLAGARDAHRAADPRERTQAGASASPRSRLKTGGSVGRIGRVGQVGRSDRGCCTLTFRPT
jgi:NAD+ synthase